MMDLVEFDLLTFEQKCFVVARNGIFIAGRNDDNLAYNLYSVFSFYTELIFNFDDDTLERINVFDKASLLEPYIEEIELDIQYF
jgi:hypothetical protein